MPADMLAGRLLSNTMTDEYVLGPFKFGAIIPCVRGIDRAPLS